MDKDAAAFFRYLEGDATGLTELVEEYGANLILFINRYVKNVDVAEDLMQDTFCDLIFYKNRYKGKSSFKTYLFSIARNKASDYLKKEYRWKKQPIENLEQNLEDEEKLEHLVLKKLENNKLYDAMKQLNEDYRMVLYLFYFEDLSYEEIAKVLKKTGRQIKNLAYRAKQSLRKVMEKEGFAFEE